MAEYQRRVVYLSNAAKDELFANGTVTVGNVTITYSDSDMYVTPTSEADIAAMLEGIFSVQVAGTTPVISAEANTRYMCGEVTSLSFTPPTNGTAEVFFTSGATPTTLTLPQTVKMPDWFVMEANRVYEISITDGIYGAVMSWAL